MIWWHGVFLFFLENKSHSVSFLGRAQAECTAHVALNVFSIHLIRRGFVYTIPRDVQMKEVMFLFAGVTKYNTFARFVKWNQTIKQIIRNSQIQGRLKLWLHLFEIQIVHYRQPDKECLIFNHSQMVICTYSIHIWKQTVQRWKT